MPSKAAPGPVLQLVTNCFPGLCDPAGPAPGGYGGPAQAYYGGSYPGQPALEYEERRRYYLAPGGRPSGAAREQRKCRLSGAACRLGGLALKLRSGRAVKGNCTFEVLLGNPMLNPEFVCMLPWRERHWTAKPCFFSTVNGCKINWHPRAPLQPLGRARSSPWTLPRDPP